MSRSSNTWHIERTAPVRADAEGLFVSAADLPDASIGDVVVISGHQGGLQRTGTIAEVSHLDDQTFFRLELHVD